MVAYAIVLILVMIFRPEGLFGSYDFSLSRIIERVMNKDFPWNNDDSDEQTDVPVNAKAGAQANEQADTQVEASTDSKEA